MVLYRNPLVLTIPFIVVRVNKTLAKVDKRWVVVIVIDDVVSKPKADTTKVHLVGEGHHLAEVKVRRLVLPFAHAEEQFDRLW